MNNPAARVRASIIIVNWNGRQHLAPCLDSLASQTFREFETIVVDNGSQDGSVPFLQCEYPWVTVVPLPDNRGFAGGNNAGLPFARGEYVVVLNNDTVTEPTWLAELVAVADTLPRVGMIASRICSWNERDRIDSLGVLICRDGMSRGALRQRRYSELSLQSVEEILFPSGCAALYRRAMLEETGFFAEHFFAYCEDTDLGLRGRWAGWQAVLATDAVVYHKYSQTGGTFSPLKIYLVERNHYLAVMRNFPFALLLLVPFFTVSRFWRQALMVLAGEGSGREFVESGSRTELLLAVVKGTRDALCQLPACWRQRRQIMAGRKIDPGDMARVLRRFRMSFRELLDGGE